MNQITTSAMQYAASKAFACQWLDIIGPSRRDKWTNRRRAVAVVARERYGWGAGKIAQLLGRERGVARRMIETRAKATTEIAALERELDCLELGSASPAELLRQIDQLHGAAHLALTRARKLADALRLSLNQGATQ